MRKQVIVLLCFLCVAASAALPDVTVRAGVTDGIGRAVAGAHVAVLDIHGKSVATAESGTDGTFEVKLQPGEYQLRVTKASFGDYVSDLNVGSTPPPPAHIVLDIAPVQQEVVVAATGVATPQTQLGQSVQVADADEIASRAGLTADEALREFTGIQVVRTGAAGGLTSVMIRGGDPSFSKIMLDGVPLQRFDFGAYDFSTFTPDALNEIQIVRGADSVVYGTDAATGVIDIHSRTGEGVGSPELSLRTAYGSFDTDQQQVQLLGSMMPLDYALTFGLLDTHNQIPKDRDWNQTFAGNVGLRLPARSRARLNIRRTRNSSGQPNAFDFYGISDNSLQRQGETYGSLILDQQTAAKWENRITLSQSAVNYFFDNPAPAGIPASGEFGTNYLGNVETIRGANGFSVTGQAILDFGGIYPQPFSSDTLGRYLTWETVVTPDPRWTLVGGYRYLNEQGVTTPASAWHSNGMFAEVSGSEWDRFFASAGVSEDRHSAFGNTLNPQASLAVLPRINRGGWLNETRIHANIGTAQKDPSITQSQSSLYAVLAQSVGPQAPASFNVEPIHPQRSHDFDLGVNQYFSDDAGRFSVTWFQNRYDDLIAFVPGSALTQLGVAPGASSIASAGGGAYLNSDSQIGKGVEMEMELQPRSNWHAGVSFTYVDAVVTRSFSSDALFPAFNPAFPTIAIGAFGPLAGARPFHVAPDSGTVTAGYRRERWEIDGNAYISSPRDDSTFLTDANFGNALLLPNHDLAPAYGTINITAIYRWNSRVTWEGAVDNLLNQGYQEIFGYPALGRSARLGVRVALTKAK